MTLPCGFRVFLRCPEERIWSLLSMFSNQLLDQHKLLLFFFHLDSVLILYTNIRHHDEKNKVLKKNRLVKNSACKKTATPIYYPNSWNKNHKGRTNDKDISFYFFCYQQLRSLQSCTDSASYLLTIFLYKKDTTHKNVFISLFPSFLLARITRIYNTSIYKLNDLHVFSLRGEIEVVEKNGSTDEKCHWSSLRKRRMRKCQSTQKQPVFRVFSVVFIVYAK